MTKSKRLKVVLRSDDDTAAAAERLVNKLRIEYPEMHSDTAVFIIQNNSTASDFEDKIREYSEDKAETEEENILITKHWGWYSLFRMILVLIVVNTFAFVIISSFKQESIFRDIALVFVTVVNWVAIWDPVETLIFERLEHLRDKKVYKHIASMKIEIVNN